MRNRYAFVGLLCITGALLLAAWTSIASPQMTRQEAPAGLVRGPWSDARAGTKIKFHKMEPNPLGDIEILGNQEVLAVQERTITVRNSGSVNGKERNPQQGTLPRFLSPAEFNKMIEAWGQKRERETLAVAGKSVVCDVYRRTEKHPTRDLVGERVTYVSEDVPSWVVRVVQIYRGEKHSVTEPYVIMDFTWGAK